MKLYTGRDDLPSDVKDFIPTGSPYLDYVLGRGVPVGRIIEFFGEEGSGKSTILLSILKQSQKRKYVPILLDSEFSFNKEWAKKIGLNLADLFVFYPQEIREAISLIKNVEKCIDKDKRDFKGVVIAWDTISSIVPKKNEEGEEGGGLALIPRILSEEFRDIHFYLHKNRVALVIGSQVRVKIGRGIASYQYTPGGMALRFYSSVRVKLDKGKLEEKRGVRIRFISVKNRLFSPFRSGELFISFQSPVIDYWRDLVELGVDLGLISLKGGWYKVEGKSFREKELVEYLKKHPSLIEAIYRKMEEL